jgi:hypothetical protein
MGQSLNTDGGVTHFNDLGVYRYLYKIARIDDLRDMYQDQVAHIATYDRRKGADLLDTLPICSIRWRHTWSAQATSPKPQTACLCIAIP